MASSAEDNEVISSDTADMRTRGLTVNPLVDERTRTLTINRVKRPGASDPGLTSPPLWAHELFDKAKRSEEAAVTELVRQQRTLSVLAMIMFCTTLIFAVLYGKERQMNVAGTYTNTFCSDPCGSVCWGRGQTCFDKCYDTCMDMKVQRPGLLSDMLDLNAIQHIGVTVSNISKSLDFYVNILGGVEVLNAGGDGWYGDDDRHGSVYDLLMQHEVIAGAPYSDYTADLTSGGYDEMAARYINFGVLQVEILDYRAKPQYGPKGTGQSKLQHYKIETAPSVVGNTHFAFLVDADTTLNEFVTQLENVSHSRGHDNVRCNTIVNVTSEVARRKMVQRNPRFNSFQVDDGDFAGWQLAYCKGPDNEQIEFNHAYINAGEDFNQARGKYVTGGTNEMWRRRLRAL